jgi:Plavaka transposase
MDGERAYSEQNTGTWWENTEKSLPLGCKLLSIILYSDATNVDTLGKSNLHPIYMTIGNIKTWRRNKPDVKQLLGFLPILKSNERNSETFKIAARETFHKSLKILLDPVLKFRNGIELTLNNESIWFYPRISIIIADWPEAATYCLTYKSTMSKFPCHFCLVTRNNLANINLTTNEMELRTPENMQNYLNQKLENSVSIESCYNYFWDLP